MEKEKSHYSSQVTRKTLVEKVHFQNHMHKHFSSCTYRNRTEQEQSKTGDDSEEQNRTEYARRLDSVEAHEFREREHNITD